MMASTSQQQFRKGVFLGFFMLTVYIELSFGICEAVYVHTYRKTIGGPYHIWELMLTNSISSIVMPTIKMILLSCMHYSESINKYKYIIFCMQLVYCCLLIWNMCVFYSLTDDAEKYWSNTAPKLLYYLNFSSDLLRIYIVCFMSALCSVIPLF